MFGPKSSLHYEEPRLSVHLHQIYSPSCELDHNLDYSIYYVAPLNLLIGHMRYLGPREDYEKTMGEIKTDETTRRWWKVRVERFIEGLADLG